MEYIALEEAFDLPQLARRSLFEDQPLRPGYRDHVLPRLIDLTEYRLPDMDEHGIAIQVLSLTIPGIQYPGLSRQQAVDDARFANDWLADAVRRHPDRFRGFAALPLQDPAAAATELQRCVQEHGFVGALVNDNTDGHYLDEPRYDVVWTMLERLDVPLYLHPGAPPTDRWRLLDGHPELDGATWSWAATTGGHALRILYSGVFDRHPGAVLILGHLGEFLPFQTSRFDSRYRSQEPRTPLRRLPSAYFGPNIKITNSGVFGPAALTGAIGCIGADNVLFSVDYPWESTAEAVRAFERTPLSETDRRKIAFTNAAALLGI